VGYKNMRKEENKSVGEKGHVLRIFILAKFHQFKTTKKQLGMLMSPRAFNKNKSTKFAISQQKPLTSQYLNIAF
jgi:hypothetical protein